MFILVEFCSKNKKSNYYLYLLIFGYIKNVLKKINVNKNSKTKFSVLKSPHVHKKAQQQIEENYYKKKILFVLFENEKLFLILKKSFSTTFQDLAINYSFIHEGKKYNLFNMKFVKLNYRYERIKLKTLVNYFKVLNSLGRKILSL